ncbi:MAG TPA: LPS export ABC transporter periplasmic protein LptC [Kaistia sp.]|nr:LPS export ABC transporter periplasmic protein LptC [Kaistia sp.]
MSSTPDASGEDGDYAWFDQTRAEIDARYRAARRHSARVRILKIVLPLVSLLAIVAFVVYVYVMPSLPVNFSASSIDVSHNAIVMQDPHVSGYLSGGRSYELKADRAEQSLQNTKVVTLQNIGATIGMGRDDSALIKAASGTYYSDAERIVLDRKITFTTTTGIEGALESADIDLKAGTMNSDKPLAFRSAGSEIKANGVQVRDRGQRISFLNGVKVTYSIPAESSQAGQRAAPSVTE